MNYLYRIRHVYHLSPSYATNIPIARMLFYLGISMLRQRACVDGNELQSYSAAMWSHRAYFSVVETNSGKKLEIPVDQTLKGGVFVGCQHSGLPSCMQYIYQKMSTFNPSVPDRCELNLRWANFKINLAIDEWDISSESAVGLFPMGITDDSKSILIQVMVSCCQPTSRCLNQFWPKFRSIAGKNKTMQWRMTW